MRSRALLFGVAAVAIYLVAVTATVAMRHDDARPLYDGFLPPPSYRFLDPPPFFAAGNVPPQDMTATIALGPGGSAAAGFATPDGQFVVSMARGAIAPAPGATGVEVKVIALVPRHLPPVPNGLRPNGNAYQVDMKYTPTGVAVTHLMRPATLLLEIPELGNTLFFSADARSWKPLPARALPPRQLSLSTTFEGAGYYLDATSLPELTASPLRSSHGGLVIGIATAVLAVGIFAGAFFVVRRRRR